MYSDPITEIRRIEADLYRFIQTASQPYQWIKDYLEPIGLFDEHVTADEFDEVECSLKNTDELLETEKQSVEALETLLREIRDLIQESARKNFPDPDRLLASITRAIFDCDHGCHIDDDLIYASLDRANLRPAFSATVVFSDTRPAGLSEIQTPSQPLLCVTSAASAPLRLPLPSPEPTPTKHDENKTEIRPALRTPRRLPGLGLGVRAA